ncbi:MAG: alpha/beta hydrolase [Desulfobacterota bacterium]|nr:alpha/beta hydrolase [Thermodesulfobacteriota bacterium]
MRTKHKIVVVFAGVALLYGALILYAYLPTDTVSDPRLLAETDGRFITVGHTTIYYIQRGSGDPIVLIHGFGGSTFTWRNVLPQLAAHFTVFALDLPGFGLSDKPPRGDYSLGAQARCVLAWMDAVHLPRATLVGHSMGGVVAAYAAAYNPERVQKLVLVEPGFYHGRAPSFLRYLVFPLQRIFAKSFYTRTGRLKSLAPSFYNKQLITDDVLDGYCQAARTPHAVDALARMMETALEESYDDIPARINVPTLLVWSSHNKNNPLSDGERLAHEIKDARLIVIQDSGHYIQEEQPNALAIAVKKFVE